MSKRLLAIEAAKAKCAECGKEGIDFKNCGACQSVCYCSSACQTKGWSGHKAACKLKKKEREKKEKERLALANGLGDMGNLINALIPADQEFHESHIYNCCWDGQHEKLQKILKQPGLDVNWGEPDLGTTAVHAAASQGHNKCLLAIIQHGGADLSRFSNKGYAPIHAAAKNNWYVSSIAFCSLLCVCFLFLIAF
jgi:ankyrin repeat protein